MATVPRPMSHHSEAAFEPEVLAEASLPDWYDRSSLVGEFMVMIAGQTEEDYLRRAPESRTCEFIDGVVFMPSPVDVWHQLDIQFLVVLLELYSANRPIGVILTGPTALQLRPECYLEPDLFVLPIGGEAQMRGFYSVLPALLVVEVLSKSTRSHDLHLKSSLYREAEIPEVWFIDDRDRAVIVERQTNEGYVTERIESGPLISRAIPGFWFDAGWLWARPRPNLLRCFEQISAGPPG